MYDSVFNTPLPLPKKTDLVFIVDRGSWNTELEISNFRPPSPCLFLFVLHVPPPTLPPPSTYVRFSELRGNEKKEVN